MREYRVEFTEKENNYNCTGEWYTEVVEAETAEEAIELLKAHFDENGGDSEDYIYRIRNMEKVTLHGLDEEVTVYMEQKTFTDEETGYEIYVTEDGRWIAEDDAKCIISGSCRASSVNGYRLEDRV